MPPAALRIAALAAVLTASTLSLQGCLLPVVAAAGVGTAAAVATDRRQPDVMLGDQRIELTTSSRINDRFKDQIHVNVTSFNYVVLLTGEATTDQTKAEAERIAAAVASVKSVVNELQVAGPSSFGSRSNDTYLTGRVKAAFVAAGKFDVNAVKVTTEAGVVYLMGQVSQQEGNDATEVARGIGGVRKVVRIFEYSANPPRAAVSTDPKK